MFLSIIIPVYNGEKYIEECLDSIFTSDSRNFEVIAVDDGSKDRSLQYLQQYAEKEQRLQVIHKENGGVSSARNAGLKGAKGDWIMFVDIDDLLESNAIECIGRATTKNPHADFILYNYTEVSESNEDLWKFAVADKVSGSLEKMQEQLLAGYLMNACWGKVYRRSVIAKRQLLFDSSMKVGEDLAFVIEYCKHVKEVACISEYLYRYRQLLSGAVVTNRSKLDDDNIRDFVKTIQCKMEYARQMDIEDTVWKKMYLDLVGNISANINLMLKADGSSKEKKKKIDVFMTEPVIKETVSQAMKRAHISWKRKGMLYLITNGMTRSMYIWIKTIK